jgi:small subunit ribosomal protein S15
VIAKQAKKDIITKFARKPSDVGSPEVQVALMTERIKLLSEHFGRHKKDTSSKRGFLVLIGKRKRLLNYLREMDYNRYKTLIEQLGLRK